MVRQDSATKGDPAWQVIAEGWQPDNVTHYGNLFLLGNGYMGYRGTLEEFGPEERVGMLLPGLYDQVGDAWREPVNAPNGFYTRIFVNGTVLNPHTVSPLGHKQEVDLHRAVHRRKTTYDVDGVIVTIDAHRFLSADRIHLGALSYCIGVTGSATVVIETGIDQRIWDLNGPHLEDFQVTEKGTTLVVTARTHEKGQIVAVAEETSLDTDCDIHDEEISGSLRSWSVDVTERGKVELQKVVAIHASHESGNSSLEAVADEASAGMEIGYKELLRQHADIWAERWNRADVLIGGDSTGQHALRYSLYQLLSSAPFHSEHLSIPARALSGQVYKGAIFWDTEIFMFPFFLSSFPEVARNLVRYRIHTLPGAKKKAREYGFAGAFYPWEGQEGGYDACTLFNITDVFTNRPMRTYFRDKQVHISGDVAWAIWEYSQVTGDIDLLWEGGWEVMLECVRFFYSYAYRRTSDNAFVLLDVTGPDEYHERVANNAYTNYFVQHIASSLFEAAEKLRQTDCRRFDALCKFLQSGVGELEILKKFAETLYVPAPDPQTRIIEQFDGYLSLEDCSLDQLKQRVLDPNEYLGGGNGLATTTQILKQADVVLMMHLFAHRFDKSVMRANWDFYEPRTEHGSSLSACAYALVATQVGHLEFAYKYFHKTATIDLTGKSKQFVGTLYIGGTHPAANGGAWMVATQGFGGVRLTAACIEIDPVLPPQWRSVDFPVCWKGCLVRVHVTRDAVRIVADATNPIPVAVRFRDELVQVESGQERCFT